LEVPGKMPDVDTKPRSEWTAADYREHTEAARRSSRFKFAEERIRKIVAGWPPLTGEQLEGLAVLLRAGRDLPPSSRSS